MGFINSNYSTEGLAEFVSNPSQITYTYIQDWFSGSSSLGKAMELLGLPYSPSEEPLVELIDNDLLVNLKVQHTTFYKDTIFKTALNKPQGEQKMSIDLLGLLNPVKTFNTLKILFAQANWIGKPHKTVEVGKKLVDAIPWVLDKDIEDIEEILKIKVWPNVFALGHICEFYNQVLHTEFKSDVLEIQDYISKKQFERDWFAKSVYDQRLVKHGTMRFAEFIKEYGIRADRDYELTCPRWYEIEDIIKKRIHESLDVTQTLINKSNIYEKCSPKVRNLVDIQVEFQVIRSTAKKKALKAIDLLRRKLIQDGKMVVNVQNTVSNFSMQRDGLSFINNGRGVSLGEATGRIMHVYTAADEIPEETIGVFPNASPEFSFQYPKCKGMIFLTGGTTSHGAIVAREFGIPAVINASANSLGEGVIVTISGEKGLITLKE